MFSYKCLLGCAQEQSTLEEEYRRAERFQEIRLGETHLFHRSLIRVKYASYSAVKRAFIRMESGESGDFPMTVTSLVLVDDQGREVKLHMERADTARKMLARMEQIWPDILYGFTK